MPTKIIFDIDVDEIGILEPLCSMHTRIYLDIDVDESETLEPQCILEYI